MRKGVGSNNIKMKTRTELLFSSAEEEEEEEGDSRSRVSVKEKIAMIRKLRKDDKEGKKKGIRSGSLIENYKFSHHATPRKGSDGSGVSEESEDEYGSIDVHSEEEEPKLGWFMRRKMKRKKKENEEKAHKNAESIITPPISTLPSPLHSPLFPL